MEDKHTAVFGIYPDAAKAEQAVSLLESAGFSRDSLSVLAPDQESAEKFAHEKHTKAPEATTAGVISGGAIGGLIGLMAGAGAPFTFPGVGLLLAAVPLAGALAGLGVGGAGGGIIGALIGIGIPEYEAKRYDNTLRGGGVLFSVHCATSGEIELAKALLKASGAEDIASTWEATAPMWPPVML
jgi:Heat induced stress protein YflT domain